MTCERNNPDGHRQSLGLIAGAGRFPFLVAEGAKKAGRRLVIIGLRGFADPALRQLADKFYWAGVVRLGSWIRIFRREGVREAIMAGRVRKSDMFGRFRMLRYVPDLTSVKVWYRRAKDKRNDSLLTAVADELAAGGIELVDSTRYCRDALAPIGVLTKTGPTEDVWQDIHFGWRIAKEMGRLDIGQAVAVKEQEIIAVEAIEGTDEMIRRAGALCPSGGWTLVKVAKPRQDMRFDVPTVGPQTVENLKRHGAKALAVEAGKTLLLQREEMLAAAERYGIVVVALSDVPPSEPRETG